MEKNEKPDYGKILFAYACLSIIITMLRCEGLRYCLGQILVGIAVLFFIYVVFIRLFIVYGRKH